MTEDVRTRIELTCIACVVLVGLGMMGYQLHVLHRMQQETSEQIATFSEEIRALGIQAGKQQYPPMPRLHFRFHKPEETPKSTLNVKTKD